MKWLITGGCGFIGTSLLRDLVAEGGHAIRIVDNLSVGSRDDLAEACGFFAEPKLVNRMPERGVELVVGDILDAPLMVEAAAGADAIVHLAANTGVGPSVEDPRSDCLTNVLGTFNTLEAARANGVGRFVFASSGAPIGECLPPIHEEMPCHPVSPYGASKLAGEAYCSAYFRTFGIATVALRFGNVYGPGSGHKSSVVAKFIRHAMMGEVLEVYGDGKQTRDFIFIGDLVRAVRLAVTSAGGGGEVFQIATARETTVNEVADMLLAALAEAGVQEVRVAHGERRLGDVTRNFSDTSKAARLLGWRPEVPLDRGLRETVAWFLQRSKVPA